MNNLIPKNYELEVLSRDLQFVGMTSNFERAYYSWICEHYYQDLGEVVDLGCWLGSTSKSLLNGLLKNKAFLDRQSSKLHVFDEFIWQSWMNTHPCTLKNNLVEAVEVDHSFLDLFKEHNREQLNWYAIYPGNLRDASWSLPIELLLVDAMKSLQMMEAIPRIFYSQLIPQKSVVMHQDYGWQEVWCHTSIYLLRDYFEFIYCVPESSTAVFRCIETIPSDLSLKDIFNQMSKEEVVEGLLWIRQFAQEKIQVMTNLSVVRYLVSIDCKSEAKTHLKEISKLKNCELFPVYLEYQKMLQDF